MWVLTSLSAQTHHFPRFLRRPLPVATSTTPSFSCLRRQPTKNLPGSSTRGVFPSKVTSSDPNIGGGLTEKPRLLAQVPWFRCPSTGWVPSAGQGWLLPPPPPPPCDAVWKPFRRETWQEATTQERPGATPAQQGGAVVHTGTQECGALVSERGLGDSALSVAMVASAERHSL